MIRVAAKAVIIKDQKLLVIENEREKIYYTLPGGGQNHNEDLHQSLKRECIEEIGVNVKVGELLFVSEYIADRHKNTIHKEGFQQLDMFFECELLDDVCIERATECDDTQTGIRWLSIEELNDSILYPMKLREYILKFSKDQKTIIYLGEVG